MHSKQPKLDEHGAHKRELLLGGARRKVNKTKFFAIGDFIALFSADFMYN